MNLSYKFISLFIVGFVAFFGTGNLKNKECYSKKINHKIRIAHPGISNSDAMEYILVEVNDAIDTPNYFYMDVESVVCGSKECKVDIVRLFWNELGDFQKLEMLNNSTLEKNEGKPFSNKDYFKLQSILSDKKSPLQNFHKHELVDNSHANAADAYSGATVVINKNAVVEGAIWTCYTLWHWANGDVISKIRSISGGQYSKEILVSFIKSSNRKYRMFALEESLKRKLFGDDVLKQLMSMPFESKQEVELFLGYLENVSIEDYCKSVNTLFNIYDDDQKVLLLDALIKTKQILTKSFFNDFSKNLLKEKSYQNIHLILSLFSKNSVREFEVNTNVLSLLKNESIVVSRKAYYFLKNQKLPSEGLKKLKSFEAINRHRL